MYIPQNRHCRFLTFFSSKPTADRCQLCDIAQLLVNMLCASASAAGQMIFHIFRTFMCKVAVETDCQICKPNLPPGIIPPDPAGGSDPGPPPSPATKSFWIRPCMDSVNTPTPRTTSFIIPSNLRTRLAPRHPRPADKKTVAVHPSLRIISGTALRPN